MQWQSIKVCTGYAACAWAILFAMPHVWWAAGVSAAFPGGDTAYEFASRIPGFSCTTDGYIMNIVIPVAISKMYDLSVVILLVASALVALALVQEHLWRLLFFYSRSQMPLAAAWVACIILTFRSLIGFVVHGSADLTFFGWPTFLTGGILFGSTAWLYNKRSSSDLVSRHGSSSFSLGK